MATPFPNQPQPQPQMPDSAQFRQIVEVSLYDRILDILNQHKSGQLNVDVMANAVGTLVGAIKTLNEKAQEQIPAQAQFELETIKAQHEMQLEDEKFKHQARLDMLRLQQEMKLKEQESAVKTQQVQQQGQLKVVETQHKLQQDAATQEAKRETLRQAPKLQAQAQGKPNHSQSQPRKQ